MIHDFKKVREFSIAGNGRLFVAPTKVKDIVSVSGSVLGGAYMLPKNKNVIALLASQLIDTGTLKKTKDAIREGLASRGAFLSFSVGGDRTYFSAHCFPADLPWVLTLAAECLSGARFPEGEIVSARTRMLG